MKGLSFPHVWAVTCHPVLASIYPSVSLPGGPSLPQVDLLHTKMGSAVCLPSLSLSPSSLPVPARSLTALKRQPRELRRTHPSPWLSVSPQLAHPDDSSWETSFVSFLPSLDFVPAWFDLTGSWQWYSSSPLLPAVYLHCSAPFADTLFISVTLQSPQ